MLKVLTTLISDDIRSTSRLAFSWLTPLLFFILVVCLFPLSVGPEENQLHQMAPGIIWVGALLAIIMSIGQLFRQEAHDGYLDVILLSPLSLTLFVSSKVLSFWITHCIPLLLICPLLGLLFHLHNNEQIALWISLLLGTPILCLWGAVGAAITVSIRQSGLLLPLLIMPLYIPVLIFGTNSVLAVNDIATYRADLALLGAMTLITSLIAPYLVSSALRIGVSQ